MNTYFSSKIVSQDEGLITYNTLNIKNIGVFYIKILSTSSGMFWNYCNIVDIDYTFHSYNFYSLYNKNYYLFASFYNDISSKYYLNIVEIEEFTKQEHLNKIISYFLDKDIIYRILIKKSGYNKTIINNFIRQYKHINITLSKQDVIEKIDLFNTYIQSFIVLNDITK